MPGAEASSWWWSRPGIRSRRPRRSPAGSRRWPRSKPRWRRSCCSPSNGPVEAYVGEELAADRPRALNAARALVDPARAVGVFADELTTDADRGQPPIIGQILRALLLMAAIVGAVVLIEFLIGRLRQPVGTAT